jgi:predicted dehydrogenase
VTIRFSIININHSHIYSMAENLVKAGAEFVSFYAPEDELAEPFAKKFPQAARVDDKRRILEDKTIALVGSSGINSERAPLGIEVMRHGKDYMVDKPGITSLEQLAEARKVQAETKRIYSICYSEHFQNRSTVKAGELVHAGAIGKLINTTGFGPHQLGNPEAGPRPAWFFERAKYGGILTDIGSHQCAQFLFFTQSNSAEVVSATVANRSNSQTPGLQDFGEMLVRAKDVTGYIRVDWFTPRGLGVWGDGRLMLLGDKGYIELRKYIDVAGVPGRDHLILVDQKGIHRIDCTNVELPYARQLIADVRDRTETAMPQARCFGAAELALTAQAMAERK